MPEKNKRHIEWALENVPLLQARGEEATARLVARAVDETQTLRVVVSMVLTLLTVAVGWIIQTGIRGDEPGPVSPFVTAAILIGLLTYLGGLVSDGILHKRIRDLANG